MEVTMTDALDGLIERLETLADDIERRLGVMGVQRLLREAATELRRVRDGIGNEVAAFRTSKQTLIRVTAEGEWSGRDIEALYEHIGHGLRNGAYDVPVGGEG